MPIRVLVYGLGPIGAAVARQLVARKGFALVGAVDIDHDKVGLDVGRVIGLERRLKVRVTNDAKGGIREAEPDVVVMCTSSSLKKALPSIETVLKLRKPIVSTTEELSYPVGRNRTIARAIDQMAKKAKVAVLGTGVNPGFAMDALPVMLSGVCERIDSVRVDRVQDARIRRLPFQQKIGAGLTVDQFVKKVKDGSVRHVGLAESITSIARAFGWTLSEISDEIAPKVTKVAVEGDLLAVDPGYVCGIVQDGVGYRKGKPVITLHMEAYLGAPESYDTVTIEGLPRIVQTIEGGIHGDIATASIAVNAVPQVLRVAPGLRTMIDMPIVSYAG